MVDRKKYLPTYYSEEDRKLIRVFQKELQRLNLLYIRAINSNDISKANQLLSKMKEVRKDLYWYYSDWADLRISWEYVKGALYINDYVSWGSSLWILISLNKETIKGELKKLWPAHIEAVNALLNTSKNYVKASLDWMERQAITMLGELQQEQIREQLAGGILTWEWLQGMRERVQKYFSRNKITGFKDRAWRIRSMDRYVDMLTRTETSIANTQGTINRAIQLGITKFKIVENSDCCEYCEAFNWEIVDIQDNIELPPYHPNCRGYIIPITWF